MITRSSIHKEEISENNNGRCHRNVSQESVKSSIDCENTPTVPPVAPSSRTEDYDKQLFRRIPTYDITKKVLSTFGAVYSLTGEVRMEYSFRKRDMDTMRTCERLSHMRKELEEFYHVSKARIYLECITESKAITILRHFIRPFDIHLISKERYNCGTKYTSYTLCRRKPIVTNTNVTVKIGG